MLAHRKSRIARLGSILTGVTAALAAVTLQCAPAAASPSAGGISALPLRAAGRAQHRAYFVLHARAGATIHGLVRLSNSSVSATKLRTYPVDGLTGVTSGAVFSNPGQPPVHAGRWVTPAISALTLPGEGAHFVPFTVQVPSNATPGDHLAGIAFEDTERPESGGQFRITEVIRVVVGVEVVVHGPASKKLALLGAHLSSLPGTQVPAVIISLANRGRLLCKPKLTVSLAAGGSQQQTPVSRKLDTILPGDKIPYPLSWPRPLGSGSYKIDAKATGCGRTVALNREVSLGKPLGGTSTAPFLAAKQTTSGMPAWLLAAIIAAAILLGAALSLTIRRRNT